VARAGKPVPPISGSGPSGTTSGNAPSTGFAVALLDEFRRLGVRDVVLSPGSRSQALALAAAEFERVGLLRLRVRIDERVGGFLALGLAVETAAPVLIITTSGTAVANLHPAVLEAHHSGVPLIVLSADRPESLRGIGSNQTTEQSGIFGSAIRRSWEVAEPTGEDGEADAAADVAREAFASALIGHAGRPGPVHVNLAFTEPLSSAVTLPESVTSVEAAPTAVTGATTDHSNDHPTTADELVASLADPTERGPYIAATAQLEARLGTVVIAGTGAGPIAEEVAHALGAPLLAEVTSGAHFGPNLVVAYRELLSSEGFGDTVDRVIVFGHPTLSREVPALIQRPGVETIVVRSADADDYNPGHAVATFADAIGVLPLTAETRSSLHDAREWLARWVRTSRAIIEPDVPSNVDLSNAEFARRQLAVVREPVTRRMLVEAVWSATWPHDRLVLGASRLIRVADAVLVGKKITVHANRGLAGIDGTIATAVGIALASQADAAAANTASNTATTTATPPGDGDSGVDAAEPTTPDTAADDRNASGIPTEMAVAIEAALAQRRGQDGVPRTSISADPAPAADVLGTTRVLLGDLAALHDAGSMLFGIGEPRPRIQVIVGNDNGGTIFAGLEVAASAPATAMERVMLTAQSVDFEKLAQAYGWAYSRVENRGDLDQALTASGPILIEVPLAR